jgi:hypothetical protein
MKNMNKIILLVSLIFSNVALSMNIEETLSEDADKIINNVEEVLSLKLLDDKRKQLFDSFKVYVETKGTWNLQPISHNSAVGSSVVSSHLVKFVDYVLSYENRLVYITITNFSDKSQLHVVTREILPISSSNAVELHETFKNNEDYMIVFDKNNYSMFQKIGYIDFVNLHVKKDNSIITYSSSLTIDY